MPKRWMAAALSLLLVVPLAVACDPGNPTPAPAGPAALPATATEIAALPTNTALPPTATPAPPTATAVPPTATETRAPAKPTATPAPEPTPTAGVVEVEEVTFESGQFTLVGDLHIPAATGKRPAVIMVHGSGESDRADWGKYEPIMERLLNAGYAVFSWDKPGIGESTGKLSHQSEVLAERAAILVAAIDFLKEHPAIDPGRIGVWGISQAGYVMPLALSMTGDIAFMIVISGPAMDTYDQGAYLMGQRAFCAGAPEEDARLIEQQVGSAQKATTYQEYVQDTGALLEHPILGQLGFVPEIAPESEWAPEDPSRLAFFDPIDAVERSTIPVLAVFGERDRQVNPFQGVRAYEQALERAGNPHSRVALFAEADHNIVLAETGCLDERSRRPQAAWLNYAPGYLDLVEDWLSALPAVSAGEAVAPLAVQLEDLPIDVFLNESFRQLQLRYPDTLVEGGLAAEYGLETNDQFTNLSDAYIRETQQLESGILDLLRGYDRDVLSAEQRLSYDIYEWYLDDLVQRQAFMYHSYPINGVGHWDTSYWLTNFMTGSLPIASPQDAEDYVARLAQLDTWMEQFLEGLTLRELARVIPPRFLLQRSIGLIEKFLQEQADGTFDVEGNLFYASFRDRLDDVSGISPAEKEALLDTALAEVEANVIPAFQQLREAVTYLATVASNEPGVGSLPQGEAYYDYALRHWTGTGLTADQVHELGRSEVARLQAEMRAAAAKIGHPADMSMAALDALFPMDADWLQGNALREEYERLIAEADSAMDAYFDLRPRAGVIVEYNPAAPPAYYEAPPRDGSGPGRMVASLAGSAQFIFYNPVVLTHHESIPGHHTQIALAQELELPANFRRDQIFNVYRQHLPFQAYTEGWALYAEGLAAEMGLYAGDPLNDLGRLRLRLHRTARLVVDTGIHAKGWTLEEAIDYVEEATGADYGPNRLAQITAVPGQACAYTIGMLKIEELRQRAMDQLGDAFDIKEFHNEILGHGPMPMDILERVVNAWVDEKLDE